MNTQTHVFFGIIQILGVIPHQYFWSCDSLVSDEPMDASITNVRNVEIGKHKGNTDQVEGFKSCVDDIFTKVDKVVFFL